MDASRNPEKKITYTLTEVIDRLTIVMRLAAELMEHVGEDQPAAGLLASLRENAYIAKTRSGQAYSLTSKVKEQLQSVLDKID